jgi:hypothetical protein
MIYEVRLVNPKTNEERKITVSAAPPAAGICLQTHVHAIAQPDIPAGFMLLGNGVRELPLQ